MSLREEFNDNGYVLLKGLLPHDLIDQHLDAIQTVYTEHGAHHNVDTGTWPKERQDALLRDLNDIHCGAEAALRLSLDPMLITHLHDLFGEVPVRHFMRTSLWHAGDRGAHFDTSAVSTWPDEHVCRTWCALEDIHPDSGIFYLVPCSHKIRLPLMDEMIEENPDILNVLKNLAADRAGGWSAYRVACWPRLSEKTVKVAKNLPKRSFALQKGDVLLFSPNVIHGTMPRSNADLPRKAIINEYRAKSARVYFCSERFGSRFHIRGDEYSVPADQGAIETRFGFINPAIDWDWPTLLPPRLDLSAAMG